MILFHCVAEAPLIIPEAPPTVVFLPVMGLWKTLTGEEEEEEEEVVVVVVVVSGNCLKPLELSGPLG